MDRRVSPLIVPAGTGPLAPGTGRLASDAYFTGVNSALAANSRSRFEQVLDPDRQLTDANAGRVIDGVRDRRGRADIGEFAEALDAGRIHVAVFFRYQDNFHGG